MSSKYRRGRKLEYTVRDMFKQGGYFVFRCAGSKPLDLIAVKGSETVLIEVKMGEPTKADFDKCRQIAKESNHEVNLISYAGQRPHGWVIHPDGKTEKKSN